MSVDYSTLNLKLLDTVVRYTPIYGPPSQISDEIRLAFLKYPRHKFIDRFRLVSQMWDNAFRSSSDAKSLELIYSNQPLMYVGQKGESLQASSSEPAFIVHLLSLLVIQAGNRILEVGCGTGWLLAMMAELSGSATEVTGVEISAYLAAKARSNLQSVGLGQANVVCADGNTVPVTEGQFDRIIYTASTYLFPQYLFALCKIGGRVIVPARNKGLAEEVQVLVRTEWGFASVDARIGKFVQMTQASGNDPSGIKSGNEALLYNIQHGRQRSMEVPGGPLGILAFSSFMSKTRPDYRVVGLGAPQIAPGARAGVFGDPAVIGHCLLSSDWSSGTVWNRGSLHSFGQERYEQEMRQVLFEWLNYGEPPGAQFRLMITESGVPAPIDSTSRYWTEQRGKTSFTWVLPMQ